MCVLVAAVTYVWVLLQVALRSGRVVLLPVKGQQSSAVAALPVPVCHRSGQVRSPLTKTGAIKKGEEI